MVMHFLRTRILQY